MAHKKAAGTAKNLTDVNPKYLGIKLSDGEKAKIGAIIVRQRGSRYIAGPGTKMSRDDSIFAMKEGKVKFQDTKKVRFDSKKVVRKLVSVE